jgi:hypothetical protein
MKYEYLDATFLQEKYLLIYCSSYFKSPNSNSNFVGLYYDVTDDGGIYSFSRKVHQKWKNKQFFKYSEIMPVYSTSRWIFQKNVHWFYHSVEFSKIILFILA